jgi:hypothetical protein
MRRRRQDPADPESVAALATVDAYARAQQVLADLGSPHAAQQLRSAAWTRREISEGDLGPIMRLRLDELASRTREIAGPS